MSYNEIARLELLNVIDGISTRGARLHVSELDQALMEVESGDVIKCDSFEDYLAKMNVAFT